MARLRRAGREGQAGGDDAPPPEAPRRLRVTGPARGRRRAGLAFGPLPVEIDPAALAPEALAAIRADPLLAVEEV